MCIGKCKTLIKTLENSISSHFVYCQAEKTVCFMWHFSGPSCCRCRLCTGIILDPVIVMFSMQTNSFIVKVQKVGFQRTFYMPPLLKSLSTHTTNPIRNLVLFSKSERLPQLEGLRCCTIFENTLKDIENYTLKFSAILVQFIHTLE